MPQTFDPDAFMASRAQAPAAFDPDLFMAQRQAAPPAKKVSIWDDPDMGASEPSMEPGLPGHPGTDVVNGLKQIGSGEFSKGIHNVASGASKAASVLLPSALFAAPLATVGGAAASTAGDLVGKYGSKALGASEDQSDVAGDVAAFLAGPIGGKLTEFFGSKAALGFANSALGTSAKTRQFGTDPGKQVLMETTGRDMGDVSDSSGSRIKALMPVKQRIIDNSPPVELSPARSLIAAKRAYAAKTGDKALYEELGKMARTLEMNEVTGQPYPARVSASQAQEILRGFGNQHPNFVEGRTTAGNDTAKAAWGQLRNDIRESAPGSQEIDDRIHNLIPGRDLATKANNLAGPVQTGINRATRPTGGMAPALMGLHAGGPVGAAATMMAQEALGMPGVKMGIARGLWRGARGARLDVPEMPGSAPIPMKGAPGLGPVNLQGDGIDVDAVARAQHGPPELAGSPSAARFGGSGDMSGIPDISAAQHKRVAGIQPPSDKPNVSGGIPDISGARHDGPRNPFIPRSKPAYDPMKLQQFIDLDGGQQ